MTTSGTNPDTWEQTVIGPYRIVWNAHGVTVTNDKTGYQSVTTPGSRDEYDAACQLARTCL